jgi:hypothetical protein
MKKLLDNYLDFEIDKLTNSIENAISGEVFDTLITPVNRKEYNQIKKSDWLFDWHKEFNIKGRQAFKLTTINNQNIIHGLISITDKGDHIFMDLIENAVFNKGKNKLYLGVAGNLVAFACKISFERNYNGIVSFLSKTQLIDHYKESLGAKSFAGNRMFIDTPESKILVKTYFKNFDHGKH